MKTSIRATTKLTLLHSLPPASLKMRLASLGADQFTFQTVLYMFLLDIVLYAFLHFYFERVMPSEFGTHLPPHFLFTPSYWNFSKTHLHPVVSGEMKEISQSEDVNVEVVSPDMTSRLREGEGICIENLQKSFQTTNGVKHAVDKLNLNFYHNQITCLLGHNGAGKTTTIAMMTGLLPITAGSCKIMGKVRSFMVGFALLL